MERRGNGGYKTRSNSLASGRAASSGKTNSPIIIEDRTGKEEKKKKKRDRDRDREQRTGRKFRDLIKRNDPLEKQK